MDLQSQTWRILHIDDDEDDHLIVRSMLKAAQGRTVTLDWASTLEMGRQKLNANEYQAVLVDYDLGTGTGIQLIREFVDQDYPAPLILLTGRGSYAVDVEAMYAGATLYLTKNEINPLLLERSIRYAIERKQFEQDLLARDRKLSVALDAAQLGTWIYSFDDHQLEMDARAQQMYASPGTHRRDHDEMVRSLVHPDDVPAMRAALEKAADPGGDGRYQAKYRILHPDGQTCWLHTWGLAEFAGQGAGRRALRLTGASRDITEQRQLQEENRRQRERLEQLIQSAPVAIAFLKGPQHVFDLINEQYLAIARGKGELLGRSMAEVWPEIADQIIPQLDRVYQTGERFSIEDAPFTLLRSGVMEEASFTYSFVPIYQADGDSAAGSGGAIEGILNLAIETTGAVRDRQAARAQNERLEAVLQALPVGVWITDAQGNILQKNQQADRIWAGDAPLSAGIDGYRAYQAWDAQSGKKLEPEDYPLARTVRSGEPVAPHEQRIRRFDDSEGTVLVSVEPIKDPAGRLLGAVAVNVDITARKQAEEALRQSDQRWSAILSSIGDAVIATDAGSRIIFMNPVAEKLTGWSLAEAAQQALQDVFHIINAGTRQRLENPLDKVFRLGTVVGLANHTLLIARDGTETPIDDSGAPVIDAQGRLTGAVLVFRDISASQLSEEMLRESEAMLRNALENTHDAVFILDRQWRYQYVNQRYVEANRYYSADFIGKVIWDVFPRYIGSNLEQQYRKVMEERVAVQFDLVSAYSGAWYEISAYPTQEGLVVFNANRTEAKKAELALRESEASYRRLAENSPEVIARVDRQLRHTYVNAYGAKVYGLPQEAVIGKSLAELGLPDELTAFLNDCLRQVFATGEQRTVDFEFDSPTLGHQYLSALFVPEFDAQGAVVSILAITRDVTELHQTAKTLQAYTAQLERSNRELQEFAYIASHDLQEPLRKVSAFGSDLYRSLHDKMTGTERDQFGRMLKGTERMQALIQDLLELSRVTTQGQPFEAVDLRQVAEEVVSNLELPLARAGGRVTLGELPVIEADAIQMERLLSNLIGNALKYHRENVPPSVQVSSQKVWDGGREMAEIQVADNGIGFDMQHAETIFQPFHRLHGRSQYEGTGIGLAICRRIAERHGGSITVHSRPGQGTTFTVRLPVKQRPV